MSTPRPGPDYEGVRSALHARGYLQTPLERLFLGRSPFGRGARGLLLGAVVTGLIAGPPLGALLAALLVLEGEGAVPVWPDGILYALLFVPVLAALAGMGEVLAGLAIRLLGRLRPDLSPRRAALAAGVAVGGLLALYLGLWWARTGTPVSWSGLLALLALGLAAGFAGRVVSAAALAQAMAVTGRTPARRGRVALGIGLLAVALALAGGSLSLWADHGRTGAAPVSVRENAPESAVLVGWDGLGRPLARGLLREGHLPWLASLAGTGALRRLEVPDGLDPAALWTSLATGCGPERHGVRGAALTGLRGASAPAPAGGVTAGPMELLKRLWPTERRVVRAGVRTVPALWEVTADARKVAVIGWWGTWPAASPGPAGGYVVSEAALVAAREGRPIEEAVYPGSWGRGRAGRWLAAAEDRAGARADADSIGEAVAREALMTDLFALEALAEALADPQVGAAVVYLPGLDILRERWRALDHDLLAVVERAARHAAVVDRRLGEVLGEPSGRRLLAVAGLPGRAARAEGLLAWSGAAALEGASIGLTDVGPTWLAAAGYTVDARMCGQVRVPVSHEVRRTRVEAAAPEDAAPGLEQEMLDRLRSLGYVEAGD